MKFIIEQKGEKFLVLNDTTGVVRGVYKSKAEAQVQADNLQSVFDTTKSGITSGPLPEVQ